ncbi:GHKL domain-containing protein [Clostridium sp. CM027]|nr:GHKL domain-containing protein [Clostridium sp. CM027]UVE42108.1 GHKL domain-containing protein [Clostridium sp. CM027]
MCFLWGAYEFSINLLEYYILYFFLTLVFQKKIKNKYTVVFIILFQSILLQLINKGLGHANFLGVILILCVTIVIYFITLNCNLRNLFFVMILFMGCLATFDFLGVIITSMVFHVSPGLLVQKNIYRVISAVTTRIVMLFFIQFKVSTSYIRKILIYQITIVLMINIFFNSIFFNIYEGKSFFKTNFFIGFITLCIILFSFVIMKIIQQILIYSKKEVEWSLQEIEYKKQIFYMNNIQELIHTLRAQRHDFNNHISCIYGLLKTGEINVAKEYSEKLANQTSEINTILNIDIPIIAALLNFKLSIAKERKIELYIEINLPKSIKIDPVNISILLGNALDNAIEACENIANGNKFIRIKMYIEKVHLIIKITNSTNKATQEGTGEHKTTHPDKENHGFGLENINYIVNKYDGLIQIEEEENLFILNIALLIK